MCVCVQDDATEAEWYDVTKLPAMAFDHKLIVRTAFERLLQHSETKSTGMLLQVYASVTPTGVESPIFTKPIAEIAAAVQVPAWR